MDLAQTVLSVYLYNVVLFVDDADDDGVCPIHVSRDNGLSSDLSLHIDDRYKCWEGRGDELYTAGSNVQACCISCKHIHPEVPDKIHSHL